MSKGLQRQQGPQHRLVPLASRMELCGPVAPEAFNPGQQTLGVHPHRQRLEGRCPSQNERHFLAGLNLELPHGAQVFAAQRHVRVERDLIRPGRHLPPAVRQA
jgi:hypothetical protein